MKTMVTVLDPAPTYDLTTLETARDELGVPASKLSDKKLKRWIGEESDAIARVLKRVLAAERVSQVFVSDDPHAGPTCLKLQRYPVVSIDSAAIDGTVLEATDWQVAAEDGLLYRVPSPWCGCQIEVIYTGGYDLVRNLPPSIEKACLAQLRHRRATAGRDPTIRSETVDTFSTTYWVGAVGENAAIVPEAWDLLASQIERSV